MLHIFLRWSMRRFSNFRFSRKQAARRTRRASLHIELLEDRTLPSSVTWVNTGSGSWDNPGNWSGNAVPGSADDVSISTSAAATITINSSDTESVHSLTTTATDTLSMTGGSLAVAANSTLSGALSMTGGTLVVNGSGAVFAANAATSIAAASIYAEGGATIDLPNLASYTGIDRKSVV